MALLRFDLYQSSLWPYAPVVSNYRASFTQKLTAADGMAWTGAFDSADGDQNFNLLAFGATTRMGTPGLVVDWNAAGDGVVIASALKWNEIKNVHVDGFTGATLGLRNFVDALIDLHASTAGQAVTVDGAKRGKIDLGSGDDTLFVGADSNTGANGGNDFFIDTGAGADTVRITRSTIDYSITAFKDNYQEKWTNSFVHLGAGNDSIVADGSNDTVWGGADNDTAELRGGRNWFDGEAGFDTIVLRGLKADYRIEDLGGFSYRITDLKAAVDGDDGTTTILNVEKAVFKDQDWLIGPTRNTAPVAQDDTATTTEDATLPIQIPVLFNDSDPDGDPIAVLGFTQGAHGTVTLGANLAYQPTDPDFNGTDSFTYTIVDAFGATATATVVVTVLPVNDAPVANDDVVTIDEDSGAILIAPLANDTDIDGDTLTLLSITPAAHGMVQQNANLVLYVPDANFNGTDQFTYQVFDQGGVVRTATVFITVNPVNDAPVAVDDTLGMEANSEIAIPIADLLANDSDPDGDSFFFTTAGNPVNGALGQAGGVLYFAPTAGFTGIASFEYTIQDAQGATDTATVTITVGRPNSVDAVDDAFSVNVDGEIAIPIADLLANDSDPNGDSFFFSTAGNPVNGALGQAGSVLYFAPTPGFVGAASFEYTIQDAQGATDTATDTATVTITVLPPPGPVAEDDAFTVAEDSFGNLLAVFANDALSPGTSISFGPGPANGTVSNFIGAVRYTPNADFSGTDSFTYTLVDQYGQTDTATVTVTVTGSNDPPVLQDPGTFVGLEDTQLSGQINAFDADGDTLTFSGALAGLVLAPDGRFTYTPAADFNGTVGFVVTVADGQGGETIGTIYLQINPVNDAPVATTDVYLGSEDQAFGGDLSLNDFDIDGDTLTYSAVGALPAGFTLATNGGFTYSPPANLNGLVSFFYQVSDGHGGTAQAEVLISLLPVEDAPLAVDDTASTAFQTAVVINVLANDSDPDGQALSPLTDTTPRHGTLALNANGTYTYTPDAGFSGADSFRYRAFDGVGFGNVATVTIEVGPPANRPPVASDSAFTEAEDFPGFLFSLAGLTNDPDNNANAWTITNVVGGTVTGFDPTSGLGTFAPTANFNGEARIDWTVTDAGGLSDSASIVVTVTPVNDAPVIGADRLSVLEDSGVTPGNLALNDFDPDGDTLVYTLVEPTTRGDITLNPDGSFTYVPAANYQGFDSFRYTVTDGAFTSGQIVVPITITSVNDAPVAIESISFGQENIARSNVLLLASDADTLPQDLTWRVVGPVPEGLVVNPNSPNWEHVHTDLSFSGDIVFTFEVDDGQGGTSQATHTIRILPENDRPTAVADFVTTAFETTVSIFPLLNDFDEENDPFTLGGITSAAHGTVSRDLVTGEVIYTPNANFVGEDQILYRLSDAGGSSGFTGVITVTVLPPPNRAPVANDDSFDLSDNTGGFGAFLLGNDTDPDGDVLTITSFTTPERGSLTVDAGGYFTYVPALGIDTGPVTFTYTITDGEFQDTATVTLTIEDTTPILAPDSYTVVAGETLVVANPGVLANDPRNGLYFDGFTQPSNGTVTFDPPILVEIGVAPIAGNFTYTPNAGFTGTDTFTYSVSTDQETVVATVTIVVTPGGNRAPVATADAFTIQENNPLILAAPGLLANDSDPDGDTVAVSGFTGATHGSVSINANGALVYQPLSGFAGTDSFTYMASDGRASSQATVTVTVVEGTPIAAPDAVSTLHDRPLLIQASTLLANDTDPNNDALFVVGVNSTGTQGRVAILDGGNLQFTPTAGFVGTTSFTYGVTDGFNSANATVTVQVTNNAPVVNGESFTIQENNSLILAAPGLLANDSDPDGDTVAVSGFTGATHGSVSISANGALVYQPLSGFTGTDSFTYMVSDGTTSGAATVQVNVVEGSPVVVSDAVIAFRDTALLIQASTLLANDSDPNGDALFVTSSNSTGTRGSVAILDGGNLLFTPSAGFVGTTSFIYGVTDGFNSANATVTVTVRPPNTVNAVDDSYSFTGPQLSVDAAQGILANDSDPDGDAFTLVSFDYAGTGQVFLADNGTFLYVPEVGFAGTETFSYVIVDAFGASDSATVRLTRLPANIATLATDPGPLSSLADPGSDDARPAPAGLVQADDDLVCPADTRVLGTPGVFRFDAGGTTPSLVTPDDGSGAAAIGGDLHLTADAGGVVDCPATPAYPDDAPQQAIALPYSLESLLADALFS